MWAYKKSMAVCWQVELCHYYCLPVKRVSKAGSFSLPGLPSHALPHLPHHNLQCWWWRYFTLLAENSLLAEVTMQSNLHALKKILAFWTASRRCVPQLCRFDELVHFYSWFGVLHPAWAHQIFCEAFPGIPFAVASSSIMKTFAPFGDSWRQVTATCFVYLVWWEIGHSETWWAGTLNFAVTTHSVPCRFLLPLSMDLYRSTQLNLLCWYNQLCIGNGIFLWWSCSLHQAR